MKIVTITGHKNTNKDFIAEKLAENSDVEFIQPYVDAELPKGVEPEEFGKYQLWHDDKWYAFDIAHGYDSCGYLARIARTSDKFSEEDQEKEIQRAIDEIVKLNINGMYTKVERSY